MRREWRTKTNASERIKNTRTIIAATKRLGVKPPRTLVRYLVVLEKIKAWSRKAALAEGKLKRYGKMEKRYAKKLGQGGNGDGNV